MTRSSAPAGPLRSARLDLLLIARLKPDGRPGGYIQMHAVRGGAVEIERRVDLEEVEMASDLHRPVAGVADRDARGAPALVGADRPARFVEKILPRLHAFPH